MKGVIMTEKLYQTLKNQRDKKREEIESTELVPKQLHGYKAPVALQNLSKIEGLKRQVKLMNSLWGLMIVTGEVLGWEKYINAVKEFHEPVKREMTKVKAKDYDIAGDTAREIKRQTGHNSIGVGFTSHQYVEYADERVEGIGHSCPLIDGIDALELLDKAENMSLWCDCYDNFSVHTRNPDMWYVHAHCLARGDAHCRFTIEPNDGVKPGENHFQTLKRLRDEKHEELLKISPVPQTVGFHIAEEMGNFSQESLLERAVGRLAEIMIPTILVAVQELGWEGAVDKIWGEKLGERFTQVGTRIRHEFGITGHTLIDAAVVDTLDWQGSGWGKRQFVYLSPEKVEGISSTCPWIDSAKEMGMEDKIGELSLVCDAYHNCLAQATNPDIKYVHTHCLGRGDKYCRFIAEKRSSD
jgi:hypothetical protein